MKLRRTKKVERVLTACAYVRVSTTEQHLGPAAQMVAIEQFAEVEGLVLKVVFLDLGVSGGREVADRPGLCAALASDVTAIVCSKRDRLAREVAIAGDIERLAAKAGKRVLSADGSNDDSDGAALKRDIDAVLSAHERRVIRRRTRDALAVKKARGQALGCAPYGHVRTTAEHCAECAAQAAETHSNRGVHLEPDLREQAVIERAKVLSDDGLSIRDIADALTAEGFHNRQGGPLTFQGVYKWLRPMLAVGLAL